MDCIEIIDDDDDEVEILDVIVNLEPKHRIIDLTDCEDAPTQENQPEEEHCHEDHSSNQYQEQSANSAFEPAPTPVPEPPSESMPQCPSNQTSSQPKPEPEQRSPLIATPQEQPSINAPRTATESKPSNPEKPPVDKHKLMMDLKNLGNEKYRRNLFDDALRSYNRANELAGELGEQQMSAIIHFNLAMTRYKLGDFNKAADECAMATKLDDKYMKAHLKRAEIYQRLGKFEEAVICYEHICELDSENSDYATLLSTAREAVKRLKRPDHYHLLGVRYNYTEDELKKAYKKLAKLHHPDRHSNVDIVSRRIQEKIYKEVLEAYNQLLALHSRCSFWRQ